MASQVGVPVKLLREFVRKKITVDTASGEVFRGVLEEAEDNLNMCLVDVKVTFCSGATGEMKSVYIKGSKVRYIALPDEAKDHLYELSRERRPMRGGRGGFRGGRGRGGGGGRRPSFHRRDY
ncbi:small nuclear ribonucleoprotein Sm D3-like [Uloborus diversus]|uniref:small nuclear ribonucleoprotein Sm D3-like n=1 Tax=Uloborus diversus TaxID=327109 RepID=UPI00240A2346|nr:small nuclear ribonucleoprotein Sm D3-like [Uloborus diversus]